MKYSPTEIIQSYTAKAEVEDQAEKNPSLRTEIPREFIRQYIKPADIVLDAGGGTGINSIMMAKLCKSVTLLDITPEILKIARANIHDSGMEDSIKIIEGDICNLGAFDDNSFTFVACVGDALSYVLDQREKALSELIRVADNGSILIFGTDSKYGFLRLSLSQGDLVEAWEILRTSETRCGMGPRTHLYTVAEMQTILERNGCQLLQVASTPGISDTIESDIFIEMGKWDELKELEMEICTTSELLGVGLHLLFIAQKR